MARGLSAAALVLSGCICGLGGFPTSSSPREPAPAELEPEPLSRAASWWGFDVLLPEHARVVGGGGLSDELRVATGRALVVLRLEPATADERHAQLTADRELRLIELTHAEARPDGTWRYDWVAERDGERVYAHSRRRRVGDFAIQCDVVGRSAGAATDAGAVCDAVGATPPRPPLLALEVAADLGLETLFRHCTDPDGGMVGAQLGIGLRAASGGAGLVRAGVSAAGFAGLDDERDEVFSRTQQWIGVGNLAPVRRGGVAGVTLFVTRSEYTHGDAETVAWGGGVAVDVWRERAGASARASLRVYADAEGFFGALTFGGGLLR